MRRIVDHDPPSLLESTPDVTIEVDRVLRGALAKRPIQRFANIGAFSRAFEAAATACARLTGRG